MLSDFHFLQPYWLLLLPLIVLLAVRVKRSNLNRTHWSKVCDPELLPFLEQQGETQKKRAFPFLALIASLLLVVAAAQPVWKQMPQPVFKKNDAVVIVLDLSASMNATDLKPSRLQRARFKVKDLLARIPDAHVSLIVYAADAFIVTPLTEDADNVLDQLPVMSPEIMPVQGSRADKALLKADQVLSQAAISKGNIVLVSDEVLPGQVAKTAAKLRVNGRQISILAVGTGQGAPIPLNDSLITDRQGNVVVAKTKLSDMQEAASIGGGHAVMISPDDRDISYLVNRFQGNDQVPEETTQELNLWVAEGPWLVLLALPLLLPLFRRGILNLLLPAVFVLNSVIAPDLYAESETAGGKAQQFWKSLWQTQDQQAYQLYQSGDLKEAAQRFKDPRWKQVSSYQDGAYEDALAALENPETASDWYNRGNTLARMGKLDEAVKAYDEALKQNPNFEDASYNRKLLEDLKQQQEQQSGDQQSEQQDGSDSQQSSQQQNNDEDSSQQNDQQSGPDQQSKGDEGQQGSSQNNQKSDSSEQQAQGSQADDAESDTDDKSDEPKESAEELKQQLKDKMDQQLSEKQTNSSQQSGNPQDQESQSEEQQARNVQPSHEPIDEQEAAREQLLNRIEDDPAGLWRRKFIYQYRQQADGQAVEEQQW